MKEERALSLSLSLSGYIMYLNDRLISRRVEIFYTNLLCREKLLLLFPARVRFRIREEKNHEYRSFQAREAEKPRGNPLSVLLLRKRWINNNLKRTSCLKEAAVRRQLVSLSLSLSSKEKGKEGISEA